MADDNKISFLLDLDIKDFTEKGLEANKIVSSLGAAENLTGLIEGLVKTSEVLAVAGVAAYAFKQALDLTIEGEEVRRIEEQFRTLADQAGISSRELKNGLEEAAHGLADTTDLLKIANRSIVEMGSSAAKLPEIMEIARKSTVLFGGDAQTNFQNLTQAIAMGNTRMLKHMGIIVDATAAVQKYAQANGLAVNELSEAGRQQAILNAVLEQGKKQFSGVNESQDRTLTSLQQIKVAWHEFSETVAVAVESVLGPKVRSFFQGVVEMARDAQKHLKAAFGKGEEADTAKLDILKEKLLSLKGDLVDIEFFNKGGGFFSKLFMGDPEERASKLKKEIADIEKQIDDLNKKKQETIEKEKEEQGQSQKTLDRDTVNKAEHIKNEERFQQQMTAIQKKRYQEEEESVNSADAIEQQIKNRQILREKEHADEIKKIQADTSLNEEQKRRLINEEDKRYKAEEANRERENAKLREKLMQNYVRNSTSAHQGIARAAHQSSAKAKSDMADFGKRGQQVMQSFETHSTNAFLAIGEGIAKNQNIAKTAADAMKAMFLNMIADRAQAEGSMLLLSGIFPPNPAAIGAGAGLIVLAGTLRSMAGSMGASSGISTGGGGGGEVSSPDIGITSPVAGQETDKQQQLAQMQQSPQRSVVVNIAGNYLNTQESQRTIMEIMRNETDATDFTYRKIGV